MFTRYVSTLLNQHWKRYIFCSILMPMILICIFSPTAQVFAQWSSAINLSPNAVSAGLNESMGSCIGVSGDTVHVVWGDRFNATHGAIYYVRSPDAGLTWNSPIAITDLNSNAWNAAIAVNGSSLHVVWRVIDTLNNHRISHYIHSLDGGNTWGPDITLDTAVADWPAVAVSGHHVYVANDIVTAAAPYNTEIFFLSSEDNGFTWSAHRQITFAVGRSEDEALIAQGPDIFMSWNDNRSGQMQIFSKHSADFGTTWDAEVAVIPPFGYGTMVCIDGEHVDVIAAGAPSGHYQIHLAQSSDTGATWETDTDLTQDPANTYYYPDMVRDGEDFHVTYVKSGVGAQYLHSADGGATWDAPYSFGHSGITPFVAYSGCVLHVIVPDSGRIKYFRNPTGNGGPHCQTTGIVTLMDDSEHMHIYPNPANDAFTIDLNMQVNDGQLVLYTLLGKEVMRKKFSGYKIDVEKENLEPGVYFAFVFDGQRKYVQKIVME
jgi:hypothetical protein